MNLTNLRRTIKALFFKLIRPLFVKGIDSNEDFVCVQCMEPVLKRQLFCSIKCAEINSFYSKITQHEPSINDIIRQEFNTEEMTAEDMAEYFGEPAPIVKERPLPTTKEELDKMGYEEARSEETAKIAARIKNTAAASVNTNLTHTGVMLCNTYTHVIKSLYSFANTIPDEQVRNQLKELIYKHEDMPANFIKLTIKK